MPIPATTECPDLTGRSFVASEEQIAEGGGTHRPSFEFITAELIEYNGSDYIDEIALRCENGSLVEVEQWASLSFDGDNVVIERGNERLVASRPTAGSACEGLFGGYGPTTDDPLILELEVKANDITFLFNDGNVVTIQYECAGENIWRRTFHGWHLVDGRILWGGDFFSSTG